MIHDRREGKWILYNLNRVVFDNCTRDFNAFFEEVRHNLDQGVTPSLIPGQPCLCTQLKSAIRQKQST